MPRAMLALAALAVALAACTDPPAPPPPPPPAPGQVTCTSPRSPMCTREYRPVCGTRSDGTRQTYGNGCTACADARVTTHTPGPCA